jgi:hypothetical protein
MSCDAYIRHCLGRPWPYLGSITLCTQVKLPYIWFAARRPGSGSSTHSDFREDVSTVSRSASRLLHVDPSCRLVRATSVVDVAGDNSASLADLLSQHGHLATFCSTSRRGVRRPGLVTSRRAG